MSGNDEFAAIQSVGAIGCIGVELRHSMSDFIET